MQDKKRVPSRGALFCAHFISGVRAIAVVEILAFVRQIVVGGSVGRWVIEIIA
jgi:hypothetical protein